MPTDAERLDWLEVQAKKSHSGISFDWIPSVEGERSGFRFMRRAFIGEARTTLRSAVDEAMRLGETLSSKSDRQVHPLAFPNKSGGNSGAWNEVHSGDRIIYLIGGRTGVLDECLQDGDALVTWDDGSHGTVKWCQLAPQDKVEVINGQYWRVKL